MSEASSARRWFQFDLRTLLLIVTIVAVWLAWRYAPAPKAESDIAKALKVGDRVIVRSNSGKYTIMVRSAPGPYRGLTHYTVEAVTDEVVRLKGPNLKTTLRIAEIARVDRYDDPPKTSTATAQNQMDGGTIEDFVGGNAFQKSRGRPSATGRTNNSDPLGQGGSSLVPDAGRAQR